MAKSMKEGKKQTKANTSPTIKKSYQNVEEIRSKETPYAKILPKKTDAEDSESARNREIEKILIDNFVGLQKAITNIAIKFDLLSSQISKLLEIFENSAKALAEKGIDENPNKDLPKKIDSLLEQNRTIAKGLALLHEKNEEPNLQQLPPQKSPIAEKRIEIENTNRPRFNSLPKRRFVEE